MKNLASAAANLLLFTVRWQFTHVLRDIMLCQSSALIVIYDCVQNFYGGDVYLDNNKTYILSSLKDKLFDTTV